MSDDDDFAEARSILGQILADDDQPVMVTSFCAVVKAIESDGTTTITTINDGDAASDLLGMYTYGLELAKHRIWSETDD